MPKTNKRMPTVPRMFSFCPRAVSAVPRRYPSPPFNYIIKNEMNFRKKKMCVLGEAPVLEQHCQGSHPAG
jgi:hypothetical protein